MDQLACEQKKEAKNVDFYVFFGLWGFPGFRGFDVMLGPQKFQTQKEKCWTFMFGHFQALVLSPNRKGFPLGVDFGASWAMFRPWAILGRQGHRRGSNLNSDVKNRYVWVQIGVLRGVFWATISRFLGI